MNKGGKISSGNDIRFYGLSFAIVIILFRPRSINQYGSLDQLFFMGQLLFAFALFAVAFFQLVQKKEKAFSLIGWLVILYKLWETVAIYINGHGDLSTIIAAANIIGATLFTELMLKRAPIEYLSTLSFYSGTMIFLNNMSYFYGGFGEVTDATGNVVYFWSTRNHLSSLFFIALIASFIINGIKRTRASTLWNLFVALNVVWGTITFQSATTIVGIASYLVMYYLFKKRTVLYQPVKLFFVGIGLNIAIVIFRIQQIFIFLIENLLNRTLTMSGRTLIWDTALLYIIRQPFWGYGQSSLFSFDFAATEIPAHNQFLDIAIICGIPGMLLFMATLFVAFRALRNYKNSLIARIICCSLLAYIIMTITESPSPYQPWFILLGMVSLIPELENQYTYIVYRLTGFGILTRTRMKGNIISLGGK